MIYLRSYCFLTAPFLLSAVLIRLYLILTYEESSSDAVWGLMADFSWSLLPALLICALPRGRSAALLLLWSVWTLTLWLDATSWIALGAPADYRDFHYVLDPVFLESSLGGVSLAQMLLAAVAAGLVGWLSHWLIQQIEVASLRFLPAFSGLVFVIFLQSVTPTVTLGDWRKQNGVGVQLRLLLANSIAVDPGATQSNSRTLLNYPDSHVNRKHSVGEAKNVLLIVVEGIPGVYLPQVAKETNVASPLSLVRLAPWAEKSRIAPQFIAPTRQTLRGLYAMLCADYPRLIGGTPKAVSYLSQPLLGDTCLPSVLRGVGYHTAFIQAADLEFMSKGTFMPAIGFTQVQGKSFFTQAQSETNTGYSWGPTDAEFFQQVLPKLKAIDDRQEPWFTTLLTAGTHYPYGIDAVPGSSVTENKAHAVQLADAAIAEFLHSLEVASLLEDTLVIVTSDESHGLASHPLGANWGLLFMMAPDLQPGIVEGVFGLVDMSKTITDYLGLDFSWGSSMLGASSQTSRPMFFGHGATVGMVDDKGVHQCGRAALAPGVNPSDSCISFKTQGSVPFSDAYQALPGVASESSYRQLLQGFRQIESDVSTRTKLEVPILGAGDYLLGKNSQRFLGGGNYLDLPPGAMLTLSLDALFQSGDGGGVQLWLEGRDGEDSRDIISRVVPPALVNTEQIHLVYRTVIAEAAAGVQFRLRTRTVGGKGVLTVDRFKLEIAPPVAPGIGSKVRQMAPAVDYARVDTLGFLPVLKSGIEIGAKSFPAYFSTGWYQAEVGGIWSGRSAELVLPVDHSTRPRRLTALVRAELRDELDQRTVKIYANGQQIGLWLFRHEHNWARREVVLPGDLLQDEKAVLNIRFEVSEAVRAGAHSRRELGMMLRHFQLEDD